MSPSFVAVLLQQLVWLNSEYLNIYSCRFHYADKAAYRDLFFLGFSEHVGKEVNVEGSPHSRAADWIMFEDPLALPPNEPGVFQRYQMALFYFLTTNNGEKPWRSCNPPSRNETDECLYIAHIFDDMGNRSATRWLSGTHECEWIGVFCDPAGIAPPDPDDDSQGGRDGVGYVVGDGIDRSLRRGHRPWLLRNAIRNQRSGNIILLQVCKCTW